MDLASAGSIVQQAAVQLRLCGSAYSDGVALTDPYSSTDLNIVRLRSFFETVGAELRGEKQWNLIRQRYVFNTVLGSGLYPLPADYDRVIDQTGWNNTNRLPLGGPISAQDRAVLKALLVNVTFTVLFDIVDGQFSAYPDNTVLPGNFNISYFYQSLWWVQKAIPAWVNNTIYTAGQVVQNSSGNVYYCLIPQSYGSTSMPVKTTANAGAEGDGYTWLYCPPWAANTVYSNVLNNGVNFALAIANGSLYLCATAGTSSASGQGPSERGVGIPDGVLNAKGVPPAGVPTWNWANALTTPNAEAPASSADVVYYDKALALSALKMKWRVENGWPISDRMEREHKKVLAKAMSADAPGKMVSLDKRAGGVPLIGSQNVPYTGWGL